MNTIRLDLYNDSAWIGMRHLAPHNAAKPGYVEGEAVYMSKLVGRGFNEVRVISQEQPDRLVSVYRNGEKVG